MTTKPDKSLLKLQTPERVDQSILKAKIPPPLQRTWDLLSGLGFEPFEGDIPDFKTRLIIDFGDVKLYAAEMLNDRFVEVVMISGLMTTPRTQTEIDIQLPLTILSRKHLIALFTFFLLNSFGRDYMPPVNGEWLHEGKKLSYLLPTALQPRVTY